MDLAKKIKISFILIILFPTIMMVLFGAAIFKYHGDCLEENYDIELEEKHRMIDRTYLLDKIMESLVEKTIIKTQSKDFLPKDTLYWDEYVEEIAAPNVSIVVYLDDEFIYNGMKELGTDVIDKLPEYESGKDINVATYYVGGNDKYLVKPVSFKCDEGDFGVVYIIGDVERILPEINNLTLIVIFIALALMTLTGSLLSLWLYRSVIHPINKLKVAADNIKSGELDFSIDYYGNDEFGSLCESFEEMREHLRESIEENLQHEKESKELISNISHDLKTPITAIKGYAEGIIDGVADNPEKMEKYVRTIYNKANDMDRLIGELTLHSRIDTNKIPYHFIKLNVADYFDDCIEEISLELENRNFKIGYLNYTEKDTQVLADPEQLRRVINNIISNSVKYNDKQEGLINIRIKDQKDFIHLEIEDNGRGVKPSELPYIFERFYRTDSSRNTKQGGSGIGLSIVKKIIEAHGGSIWAYSAPETGLSIHFLLKKPDKHEEQITEENETVRKKKRKRKESEKSGRKESINN